MSDAKEEYSEHSHNYVESVVPASSIEQVRYNSSKEREKAYNDNWIKCKIDINDAVNKYTPGISPVIKGVKAVYKNSDYEIKADMAAGYLRIYDRKAKTYLDLDGNPSSNYDLTHLKIKRREEMQCDSQ